MILCFFHAEATRGFEEAANFYESRVPRLGKSFSSEVERTVRLLREYPDAGAPLGMKRRRVLVDRFPYYVAYQRREDSIVILAIAHQKRRPGYWRKRR